MTAGASMDVFFQVQDPARPSDPAAEAGHPREQGEEESEDGAAPVPEAATLFLVGSGLLGIAFASRRRIKKVVTGEA